MTSQATNQIVMTMAANIVRAREEAGLTQRELGAKIDMDSRGISRWENGKVMPSRKKLEALAAALGRDSGWFYVDHAEELAA